MQPYVGFRTELKHRLILERIQNMVIDQMEDKKDEREATDESFSSLRGKPGGVQGV